MHTPVHPFAVTLAAGLLTAVLGTTTMVRAEPPTPEAIVDAFEAVVGPVRTHRPSHAKGTCAAGHFIATPEGTAADAAPTPTMGG